MSLYKVQVRLKNTINKAYSLIIGINIVVIHILTYKKSQIIY